MLIENPDKFKSWLSAKLKTCCYADPIAVGRYIFALVKKDKSPEELRKFLLDQLEIFLCKGTGEFVDLLFEAIRTKSYIKEDFSDIKNGPNKGKNPSEISPQTKKDNEEKNSKGSIQLPPDYIDRTRSQIKPKEGEGISDECDISQHSYTSPKSSVKEDQQLAAKKTVSEERTRCPDYDERGYCVRGDLCRFDHGKDPILVEDVSVFHFAKEGDRFYEAPPLPPCSPPKPPPPPPLPPPLTCELLGTNVPQPYNPEFPGYWGVTPCEKMLPPIPSTAPAPAPSPRGFYPKNLKPQRTRELIGIKTIGGNSLPQLESKLSSHCDSSSPSLELKRKSTFDFKRLGPPRKKTVYSFNRNTLELRNVPVQLNNIDLLNRHFSKFGHVASLEIGYDNDPHAALVKFVDPNDASVAYRSSDAILNNRFIKVFFKKDSFPDSENSTTLPMKKNEIKTFDERSLENKSIEMNDTLPESDKTNPEKEGSLVKMHASVFSKKGNLSRTIFNPSALKSFSSAKNISTTRKKLEKKEDTVSWEKKLVLLRRKKTFLLSAIEHEKLIIEKMAKCKNPKEMNYLKETIQNLTSKISTLKDEIKEDSEALKNHLILLKSAQSVTKSEAERKLLDAEMDLYREKSSKGEKETFPLPNTKDETAQLLSRVSELQKKAKAFIDSNSSTTNSTHKHSKIQKNVSVSSPSIDHHAKKIMDTQSSAVPDTDCLKDSSESKDLNTKVIEGDDEEEEDEEEDSEARSWRR